MLRGTRDPEGKMTKDQHFIARENLYLAAPITEIYHPSIEILEPR